MLKRGSSEGSPNPCLGPGGPRARASPLLEASITYISPVPGMYLGPTLNPAGEGTGAL